MKLSKLIALAAVVVSAASLSLGAATARADNLQPVEPVPVTLLPRGADLFVASATWNSVTIRNGGTHATGGFYIRVQAGHRYGECYNDPVPTSYKYVPGLGPFGSITLPIDWSSTNRQVRVDIFNAVAERNEFNNLGTIPGVGSVIC